MALYKCVDTRLPRDATPTLSFFLALKNPNPNPNPNPNTNPNTNTPKIIGSVGTVVRRRTSTLRAQHFAKAISSH